MKIRLFNLGILASVLLMTLSGCSSDETFTNENDTAVKSMKINISDGLFTSVDDSGAKTRATDNGTGTTFASGDAIGIFAVKPDVLLFWLMPNIPMIALQNGLIVIVPRTCLILRAQSILLTILIRQVWMENILQVALSVI